MFFSSIFSYFPILLRLYQAGLIKDVDTIAKLEKEVTIFRSSYLEHVQSK